MRGLVLWQWSASAPLTMRSNKACSTPIAASPVGNDIPEAIREMNARLGLPTGLAAMGVEHALFERIVSGALADHCHKTNPRIASADDYRELLETSL